MYCEWTVVNYSLGWHIQFERIDVLVRSGAPLVLTVVREDLTKKTD